MSADDDADAGPGADWLAALLAAWRADVESDPVPQMTVLGYTLAELVLGRSVGWR